MAPILVGKFGAPHGVRGEVRLQSYTSDPRAIGDYGALSTKGGRRFDLLSVKALKGSLLIVRVAGIGDREAAAALTNIDLYVDRAALPSLPDDEFYHADLVGMEARDEGGQPIGRVIDVVNFKAGDLLEVQPDAGESLLFPFTRAVVPTIDFAARTIVIVAPEEVSGPDPRDD